MSDHAPQETRPSSVSKRSRRPRDRDFETGRKILCRSTVSIWLITQFRKAAGGKNRRLTLRHPVNRCEQSASTSGIGSLETFGKAEYLRRLENFANSVET